MLIEFLNDVQDERLLKVIGGKYPEIPYNKLNSMLRKKDIRVNGKKVNENVVVTGQDLIQLYIPSLEDTRKNRSINIFYRDENILIAEKPQGIEVEGNPSLTQLVSENASYIRACHRLDRNTTGLVVFALSERAYTEIVNAFSRHSVDKYYLALIFGSPEKKSDTLNAYLFKDSKKSLVYINDTGGKGYMPVSLEYNIIEEFEGLSLTEIKLITGKTHQIRAQFAHIGFPVLGDGKYGKNQINQQYGATDQQLYAYRLKFNFPEDSFLAYLSGIDFTNSLYLSDLREFNPQYRPENLQPVIKNYDMEKRVEDGSFPPYSEMKEAMDIALKKEQSSRINYEGAESYAAEEQQGLSISASNNAARANATDESTGDRDLTGAQRFSGNNSRGGDYKKSKNRRNRKKKSGYDVSRTDSNNSFDSNKKQYQSRAAVRDENNSAQGKARPFDSRQNAETRESSRQFSGKRGTKGGTRQFSGRDDKDTNTKDVKTADTRQFTDAKAGQSASVPPKGANNFAGKRPDMRGGTMQQQNKAASSGTDNKRRPRRKHYNDNRKNNPSAPAQNQ